jgi:hypothetical protein
MPVAVGASTQIALQGMHGAVDGMINKGCEFCAQKHE